MDNSTNSEATEYEKRMDYLGRHYIGEDYHCQAYYTRVYRLTKGEWITARKNGLPYVERYNANFYSKKLFHDYFAGRIGNDVRN